jgi:NADPH-dependent glutamate synthase beta subunit-like oxidoreductase
MASSANKDQTMETPNPFELADDTGDKHYVPAPCQLGCPIGTDAPSYIALIWEEKLEEAYEAITATNPFSSSCGRICAAPCEDVCRRADSDGTIGIRNLKRFVMERLGDKVKLAPVAISRTETIGIVGGGPAGLTAAQDLAMAGFEVHVYELSGILGGMVAWGIPFNRLPPPVLKEDIDRILERCPGIKVHLNCTFGEDVSLDELKERHDSVLLTIGATWGKPLPIEGTDHPKVWDGVEFLHRANAGETLEVAGKVIVIGGGDVAMDVARTALRMGASEVHLSVLENRNNMRAHKHELHAAMAEDIGLHNDRLPQRIEATGSGLILHVVKTTGGGLDENGQLQFEIVKGSDYEVPCDMVMTAVGQQALSDDLDTRGMMERGCVITDDSNMGTSEAKVYSAGDSAFGGSTIVEAMRQGHKAAYYIKAAIEGIDDPIPYKTPHRTRRVKVAQDLEWSNIGPKKQEFIGLGSDPKAFEESEIGYDRETAIAEAARCFRCDAETGSSDYSVKNREDIFSMARTNPMDHAKHAAMLKRRLPNRENPYPDGRGASLDDLTFLPANLSRLVIDPYREACKVSISIRAMELPQPFIVTGFDTAPQEVRAAVAAGLAQTDCPYLGAAPIAQNVRWLQLLDPGAEPSKDAAALVYRMGKSFAPIEAARLNDDQLLGVTVSSPEALEEAIPFALEAGFDMMVLDASGEIGGHWPELAGPPDLTMMRDAIRILRRLDREEEIDLVFFGGLRSGTDASKVIAMGCVATLLGAVVGFAAGGVIVEGGDMMFEADYTAEDRTLAVANILKAATIEASMMARCTGKTALHNLEPEDLRSVSLAGADATDIVLVGKGARTAA